MDLHTSANLVTHLVGKQHGLMEQAGLRGFQAGMEFSIDYLHSCMMQIPYPDAPFEKELLASYVRDYSVEHAAQLTELRASLYDTQLTGFFKVVKAGAIRMWYNDEMQRKTDAAGLFDYNDSTNDHYFDDGGHDDPDDQEDENDSYEYDA